MIRKSKTNPQIVEIDRVDVFETLLGWMAAMWSERRLYRLAFGQESPDSLLAALPIADWDVEPRISNHSRFAKRMRAYADGAADDFRDIAIVENGYTLFQRNIVRHCRNIGYGNTQTYGELAAKAGSARAARAVGTVMARNRLPLVVPCHRVVGAGGSLNGFSAPGGLATKERLLQLERQSADS